MSPRLLAALQAITLLAALGLGVYVVLRAGQGYTGPERAVLFLLAATIPGILFASRAAAQFEVNLPTFMFAAGGGAALLFGAMFSLDYISKPDYEVTVAKVVDANGDPVQGMEREGAVSVQASGVEHYVDGNVLVLRYPEQTPQAVVRLRPSPFGPTYRASLSYTERVDELILCTHFLSDDCPPQND